MACPKEPTTFLSEASTEKGNKVLFTIQLLAFFQLHFWFCAKFIQTEFPKVELICENSVFYTLHLTAHGSPIVLDSLIMQIYSL